MGESPFAPVSVVVPCYRCKDTIDRALASVDAQTWQPAEVILVDDASDDGTLTYLHEVAKIYPAGWIQIIELPANGGPGTARNAGWARAGQSLIAFLDADDAWHAQKVEIQCLWMLEHPEAALTGHASVLADQNAGPDDSGFYRDAVSFTPVNPRRFLFSNRLPTRSVMLRRDLPHRFVEGKYYSEDFLLWCEICLDGHATFHAREDLAYFYKRPYGDGGLSSNLWPMQKGQLDSYRRLQRHGRLSSVLFYPLIAWSLVKFCRRLLLARIGHKRV